LSLLKYKDDKTLFVIPIGTNISIFDSTDKIISFENYVKRKNFYECPDEYSKLNVYSTETYLNNNEYLVLVLYDDNHFARISI